MRIRLSNPVVCFTLGSCQNFQPFLRDSVSNYVSDVGYINVPLDFDEDFVRAEVKRVWQDFLGVHRTDILRANFFVNADDTAVNLPELIIAAEKFFSPLYPAGILGDIYCLFDDSNLIEEMRKAAVEMLNEIKGDGLNIYLLSNLTSSNAFIPPQEIAQTVALLTLFKNSSPSLNVTEADASRYNELFFLKNCSARNGDFLTASSVNLNVPTDALKSLLIAEILKYDDTVVQQTPLKTPAFPQKNPLKSMEYLYGLAMPDVGANDQLPRGQWLKRCFGQRLENLGHFDKIPDAEDVFQPEETNIYDLLRTTGEGGFYEKSARENTENAIAALQSDEEKLAKWLNKPPEKTEYTTRRLSPLKSQELLPFTLAHGYLRKQNEIQHTREKIKILERQQRQIAKYHKKLKRYEKEIIKTITEHEAKTQAINDMFKGFREGGAAVSYFQEKFQDYAEAHESELADLHREMLAAFGKNEFSKFKARLMDFVEKSVLTSQEFDLSITLILEELTGTESLPDALSEWVSQNSHFGIRLKTGYAKLHMEANLYVPQTQAFEAKKSYEQRGLGRMNLFANENQISVLYHAGAFNLEELYW